MKTMMIFLVMLVVGLGCYQDKPSYEFQYSIVLNDGKQVQMDIEYRVPYSTEMRSMAIITPWTSEKFDVNDDMFYCRLNLKSVDTDYTGYIYFLLDGKTEQKSYLYHEDDTWAGVYIDPNHDETTTVEIE